MIVSEELVDFKYWLILDIPMRLSNVLKTTASLKIHKTVEHERRP